MEGEDAIFSWFKSAKPVEDTDGHLDRLDQRQLNVEKAMRRLEEEWTDVYHKFRVLQMRVAKQVQRLDASSSQEGGKGDGETQLVDSGLSAAGSSLSPRMQRIQKDILERRQRRAAPVAKEGGE